MNHNYKETKTNRDNIYDIDNNESDFDEDKQQK